MGILLTLLSTAAALGGIYFGAGLAKKYDGSNIGQNRAALHKVEAAPQFAAPDIFVYPLQRENALGGYLVVRFALPIADMAAESSVLSDEILLADAFYASMFMMRTSVDTSDKFPQPDEIADVFLQTANRSAASPRFEAALWQQFDVFEPEAMRRKNVRERNISEPETKTKAADTH